MKLVYEKVVFKNLTRILGGKRYYGEMTIFELVKILICYSLWQNIVPSNFL
jgi:hypothetical protein